MEDFENSVRRHRANWESFSRLMFWFSLHTAVVLILLAIFLL